MTCADLARKPGRLLLVTTSIQEALASLLELRQRSLPVVSDEGTLIGMFGVHHLLDLLRPEGSHEDDLQSAHFLHDQVEDLARRLRSDLEKSVGDFMDPDPKIVHAETAASEAVLLLDEGHDSLPVVDPETQRLLGILTYWDILAKVADLLEE